MHNEKRKWTEEGQNPSFFFSSDASQFSDRSDTGCAALTGNVLEKPMKPLGQKVETE